MADSDGDSDAATANVSNLLPVAPRVSVILNDGDVTIGNYASNDLLALALGLVSSKGKGKGSPPQSLARDGDLRSH